MPQDTLSLGEILARINYVVLGIIVNADYSKRNALVGDYRNAFPNCDNQSDSDIADNLYVGNAPLLLADGYTMIQPRPPQGVLHIFGGPYHAGRFEEKREEVEALWQQLNVLAGLPHVGNRIKSDRPIKGVTASDMQDLQDTKPRRGRPRKNQ